MHSKKEIIDMRNEGKGLFNQGTFWTEVDKELLKDAYLDGDSISEIALNRGRSESAIMNKLKQLKMLPPAKHKKKPVSNTNPNKGGFFLDGKKQ